MSALELSLYMRNQLLRDSDVMSMAWGLELRVPFVDQQLVAQLATIPAALEIAVRQEAVASRPCRRFRTGLPPSPSAALSSRLRRWFDSEWEELFRGVARKFGVKGRTWYQKWAIFVFEHWCREHGVS